MQFKCSHLMAAKETSKLMFEPWMDICSVGLTLEQCIVVHLSISSWRASCTALVLYTTIHLSPQPPSTHLAQKR